MADDGERSLMLAEVDLWLVVLLALATALAGAGLLAWSGRTGRVRPGDIQRRFAEALDDDAASARQMVSRHWMEVVGQRMLRVRLAQDDEVKLLLVRAGWKRKSDLAFFLAVQTLLPVLAALVVVQGFFVLGVDQRGWAILFLVAAGCWLLPKRVLAYLAAARRARIAEQTPILVHLLSVLLNTGLSVEQALRSLVTDTRELLPDLAAELDFLLRRIEAGEDLAVAMLGVARQLDVPALTDLAMIVEQTWRMGGNVLKSLTDLSNLIEERMQTDIKERVSKLSGKMTVVMMLFLFPALLIFLAAPGFLAIIEGLKSAAG